jgi:outer membrane lipoprotein SlyB
MKPLRMAFASLAVLGLAGCASMDERSGRVTPQRASPAFGNDAEYITQVEAVARRRYMDVVWVNPPKKRVRRDD